MRCSNLLRSPLTMGCSYQAVHYCRPSCTIQNHSAVFPAVLLEWFSKLFTKEGDTVLAFFMGNGTTHFVANSMKRHAVAIEMIEEQYNMVEKALKAAELYLPKSKIK